MATITIELPDDTPVISLMRFAAELGCDMTMADNNRFKFNRNASLSAVVRMPARVRAVNGPSRPEQGRA